MNGGFRKGYLTERHQGRAEGERGDSRGDGDVGDLAEAAGRFVHPVGVSVGCNLKKKYQGKDSQQQCQRSSEGAQEWVRHCWHFLLSLHKLS